MFRKKLINLVIEKEQKIEGVLRQSSLGRTVLRPYLSAKYQRIKAPRRMFLEPTSICNFKCPKCPHPEMTRPGEYVDLEKYERFLRSWAADIEPFEIIEFTGGGEVSFSSNSPSSFESPAESCRLQSS